MYGAVTNLAHFEFSVTGRPAALARHLEGVVREYESRTGVAEGRLSGVDLSRVADRVFASSEGRAFERGVGSKVATLLFVYWVENRVHLFLSRPVFATEDELPAHIEHLNPHYYAAVAGAQTLITRARRLDRENRSTFPAALPDRILYPYVRPIGNVVFWTSDTALFANKADELTLGRFAFPLPYVELNLPHERLAEVVAESLGVPSSAVFALLNKDEDPLKVVALIQLAEL